MPVCHLSLSFLIWQYVVYIDICLGTACRIYHSAWHTRCSIHITLIKTWCFSPLVTYDCLTNWCKLDVLKQTWNLKVQNQNIIRTMLSLKPVVRIIPGLWIVCYQSVNQWTNQSLHLWSCDCRTSVSDFLPF